MEATGPHNRENFFPFDFYPKHYFHLFLFQDVENADFLLNKVIKEGMEVSLLNTEHVSLFHSFVVNFSFLDLWHIPCSDWRHQNDVKTNLRENVHEEYSLWIGVLSCSWYKCNQIF